MGRDGADVIRLQCASRFQETHPTREEQQHPPGGLEECSSVTSGTRRIRPSAHSGGPRREGWRCSHHYVLGAKNYATAVNESSTAVGWDSDPATITNPGGSWTAEFLADYGLGSAAFAISDAGQIVGEVESHVRSNRPAYWNSSGTLRELEGRGDALGLTEPAAGPVVAGKCERRSRALAALMRR